MKENNMKKHIGFIRFIITLIALSLLAWLFLYDGLTKTETKLGVREINGTARIAFIGNEQQMMTAIDNQLNSGLTELQPDGNWKPSPLTESFTVSDDRLSWTAVLKKNLKWSDGSSLTVDDILNSLKTNLNAGDYGARLAKNIKSIHASNDSIIFALRKPMTVLPFLLSDPAHAIIRTGADNRITSGYYSVNNKTDDSITLKANAWIGNQHSGTIAIKTITDDATALKALDENETDYVIKDSRINGNVDTAKYDVNRGNSTRRTVIAFNGRLDADKPLFSDAHFRQGFRKAIDRNAVMDSLGDDGNIIGSPYVPGTYGYQDDTAAYAYDPAGGRYLSTAYFGIRTSRLLWPASRGHAFGETIDNNLAQIVQYTKWEEVDDTTYNQRMTDHDYEMALMDMTGIDGFKNLLSGNALTSINDQPEVDDTYDAIFTAADDNALIAAIRNAAAAQNNASQVDWLYAHKTTVISRKGLNAVNPNLIDASMRLQDAGEK